MEQTNVFTNFKSKVLTEGYVQEANEQDLFDQVLTFLTVVPLTVWGSFAWAKTILTGTNFMKDMKAAKTTEQKKSVIKKYFSLQTLEYITDPTNMFSYTENVPGTKDKAADVPPVDTTEIKEAKPSAGLTKKQKSNVVKKAKAGEDIGAKGKSFEKIADKVEKEYGKDSATKIAASVMWKNVKR